MFTKLQLQLDVLLIRAKMIKDILEPVKENAKEEWVIMEGVVNEIYQLTLRLEQRLAETGCSKKSLS